MFKALAPRHLLGVVVTGLAIYGAVGSVGCTVTTSDTCDPNVDPNCQTTCDPNTDPNHCQTTCDPNTDPNHCQTNQGTGAVDVLGSTLISNGGDPNNVDIVNIDNSQTTKASIILSTGSAVNSIVNYVEITTSTAGTTGTLTDATQTAHFTGLPNNTQVTFTVTGYLRGLNGNNADTPTNKIQWASTTCTATTASDSTVVQADCTPMVLGDQKGILFASDVLPDGTCTNLGSNFLDFRARTPFDGTAQVSVSENDCQGVIWVDASSFSEDSTGASDWGLSLETNSSSTACSLGNPCHVVRDAANGENIHVVGSECQIPVDSTCTQ